MPPELLQDTNGHHHPDYLGCRRDRPKGPICFIDGFTGRLDR
jgi:hypothetical protein